MSKTPFMPLWVSDFVGDTLGLDAKEIGAYMLILMTMWGRDGTLPADQAKLKRVARIGRDWPKVWASISHYFTEEDGMIFNKRLSQELLKVNTKRVVNAQSGARGGRAKALKTKETGLANATDSLYQPEPEPYREKRDTKVSPKKRATRLPDDWQLPKHFGDWALEQGWTHDAIRLEADKFKDYWIAKSGKDATKLDWLATWRNWIRNSKTPKGKTENGKRSITERLEARFSEMDFWEGGDAPESLLQTGGERGSGGGGDDGLDQGIVKLFAGPNQRGV